MGVSWHATALISARSGRRAGRIQYFRPVDFYHMLANGVG
jgi:hypothetical protein